MFNALEVSHYNFTAKDQLFLDANIWLYLYGPQKPKDPQVATYSNTLKRIIAAKSLIFIDVLIASEFINAYARIQWKVITPNMPFKRFRDSHNFKPIAEGITDSLKRVMRHCTRIESGFEKLQMDTLFADYSTGNFDFNDQVIVELCKGKGLTLITHDGDFKGQGISVLTANKRLLNLPHHQ